MVEQLRLAVDQRRELADGYAFELDAGAINLREAAEWIDLERRCCPFLTLQLQAGGGQEGWLLTLRGPAGVKALLDAELALPSK